jgi:tRNA dimethylallyltransferase
LEGSRVRVICGPTAAGKSAIASQLALEYGATVVNADSRQVYRGFDIGTAKPDWSERKTIAHECIDVAEPGERFSASRWAAMAMDIVARCRGAGGEFLVAGGTGFYIRALFDPLFDAPEIDERLRDALENFLNPLSLDELRRWCREIDPARAHLGRYQLVRAILVALATGERISALHARQVPAKSVSPAYLLVDPGESLGTRIERRVDAMIDAGWLDEVRSLDTRVPGQAPAWKSSGYRVMRALARGEIELSEARARIIIETRQYAKRQRTWFRHQLGDGPVTTVNPDDPGCQAVVQRWWKETS